MKPQCSGRQYLIVGWNMDETAVFWKAIPDRGFGVKGKGCHGGKKNKQCITVAFFVSAAGTKEKPVVVWRSEKPRCLKGLINLY